MLFLGKRILLGTISIFALSVKLIKSCHFPSFCSVWILCEMEQDRNKDGKRKRGRDRCRAKYRESAENKRENEER